MSYNLINKIIHYRTLPYDFRLTTYDNSQTFLLFSIIICVIPILCLKDLFDRYLLTLLPPIIIITSINCKQYFSGNNRLLIMVSKIFIFVFLVFSIFITKDYLEWNRNRWNALDYLVFSQHVSSKEIDGGYEFNGLNIYSNNYSYASDKNMCWVDNAKYVISFGDIPGYSIIREYKYYHFCPPYNSKIFILKSNSQY